MYHSILASPKEVSKLLKKLPANDIIGGEVINPNGETVTNLEPGSGNSVMESELETNLDNGEASGFVDIQPGCDELLPPNKNFENISKKNKMIKVKKLKKVKKVKQERIATYDFKRLSNIFSKPDPASNSKLR